jgi:hypothetical protein
LLFTQEVAASNTTKATAQAITLLKENFSIDLIIN